MSATNTTVTSTILSWSASTDNVGVTGYKVFQNGNEIAEVTGTSYSVSGLNASTQYTFTVAAFDVADNVSAQSSGVTITTATPADTSAPTRPSGLSATNTTVTSTVLSWSASTDNVGVTGYKVFQNGNEIAEVTGTSYSVSGLNASTQYTFTVAAFDVADNISAQSSPILVTTETATVSQKVLVFTKTSGFNHNTKSESVTMVRQIATNQNFELVVDDTGSEFNSASNLNQYAVIFFTNTSGNTLNQTQRNNVEAYAAQGGNFISNHAASDSYGHSTASTVSGGGKGVWDWYAENVTGCSVRNNPNHTSVGFAASVTVQNQNNQLTSGIGFPWNDNEEWYYWEGGYIDSSFTELLRVSDTGSNTYDDARMTAQYWVRPDGGKSFYSSMGHSRSKYSDSDFVRLISNAFAFILN